MDIGQFVFPFIMAVLTNSLMIIIIYFLRKVPLFANLFSVGFMVVLYLFCLLRIFVPIEFPGIQVIIEDGTLYTAIMESVVAYDDATHSGLHLNTVGYIIIGVWIIGTVIIGLHAILSQNSFRKNLMANCDCASENERKVFFEVAREILKTDKNVTLRKTDAVTGTIVIGLIHKKVLIPDGSYSDDELRMIFRHECTHIKNKDLWIKLLVQVYCSIFWWNPFAYLLKADLDFSLEMRCDLNAVKNLTDKERLVYAETLVNHSRNEKRQSIPFVVSAGFADSEKKDKLLVRIQKLLSDPPNKTKQIIANVFAAVVLLSIFAASYVFIWQPNFRRNGPTEESYTLSEGERVINNDDAYLIKCDDGSYLFYVSNYPPIPVTKEEIEQGMYEDYPIYEK